MYILSYFLKIKFLLGNASGDDVLRLLLIETN